jgi:circadian clock protein KaiC
VPNARSFRGASTFQAWGRGSDEKMTRISTDWKAISRNAPHRERAQRKPTNSTAATQNRDGAPPRRQLDKCPTGVQGLDEITNGGLPRGRPTLVCGAPGCGKTLLAMEFLVRGAVQFDEPGVFVSFEEDPAELTANVRSLGFDLDDLQHRKKLVLEHVRVERNETEETGEYDLEGLFIRIGYAVDTVKARRVVLDTIESLFAGLSNTGILRAELRRLFAWLKQRGLTAVITGERGDRTLTRHGLEEYVSDCVISLDHRLAEQISTRRMRIVKYRGSAHGTNEYPFLIDNDGISVMPITSLGLQYEVSNGRVPSGVLGLDEMLGGTGYFRGSSILVSGTAGSGKTSIVSHCANAACGRGERVMYFAFEESPGQIIRDMRSIGLDLQRCVSKGLLRFAANRPGSYGLEMHLAAMHKEVRDFAPQIVLVDPVSSLLAPGALSDTKSLVTRLLDQLKMHGITSLFTSLTQGGNALEATDIGISSLMDTWLLVRDIELAGERNRALYVLKSRGMAHSNQIREFVLSNRGIELRRAYLGPGGVLTGSARLTQEAQDAEEEFSRVAEAQREEMNIRRKKAALEGQLSALRAEIEAADADLRQIGEGEKKRARRVADERQRMAVSRKAAAGGANNGPPVRRRNRT